MTLWMVFISVSGIPTFARGYVVDALHGSRVVRTEEPRVVVPEVYYVVVGERGGEVEVVPDENDMGLAGGGSGGGEKVDGDVEGEETGMTHIYLYRYSLGSSDPVPVEGPDYGALGGCRIEKVYVGTDLVGSRQANERVMEERLRKFTSLGARDVKPLFGVGRVAIVRCKGEREEKP